MITVILNLVSKLHGGKVRGVKIYINIFILTPLLPTPNGGEV